MYVNAENVVPADVLIAFAVFALIVLTVVAYVLLTRATRSRSGPPETYGTYRPSHLTKRDAEVLQEAFEAGFVVIDRSSATTWRARCAACDVEAIVVSGETNEHLSEHALFCAARAKLDRTV